MEILGSKKTYKAPLAKVVEVNVQGVLCQSTGTEKFSMSGNSYDDDDFEF